MFWLAIPLIIQCKNELIHLFPLEHRSTSCSSSLHNCHISTLQLNSTYPNLDTFIHHRRCRRTRTVFSGKRIISIQRELILLVRCLDAQLIGLEKRFETQKYLSTPDRIELADMLHLSQLQVKTWSVLHPHFPFTIKSSSIHLGIKIVE